MKRMVRAWAALMLALPAVSGPAIAAETAPAAPVKLWRLDCGTLPVSDFGAFSDTGDYDGQPHRLVDSCYLVQHGGDYLLWDTGLPTSLIGKPMTQGIFTVSLARSIPDQLHALAVKPEQIRYVGISHHHWDHTGQVGEFPGATLLIGAADLDIVKAGFGKQDDKAGFKPWIVDGAKVEPVTGDKDVFGDGSVVMLTLPGHTPGHHALKVRLKGRTVLLGGDQAHASQSLEQHLVPVFNADRADTLASFDRFDRIAKNSGALVIVQHEPADVAKLPAFPKAAE